MTLNITFEYTFGLDVHEKNYLVSSLRFFLYFYGNVVLKQIQLSNIIEIMVTDKIELLILFNV